MNPASHVIRHDPAVRPGQVELFHEQAQRGKQVGIAGRTRRHADDPLARTLDINSAVWLKFKAPDFAELLWCQAARRDEPPQHRHLPVDERSQR
jgi:hypothetical protein